MALQGPSSNAFPAFPASWYLFGNSAELRRGPVSRRMLGRRLVAYRTASGRLAMLDGDCSHFGADLGKGRVVGEALQCPFHHWEYGSDGRCVRIPVQEKLPSFARQATYPVEERHGYIFVFNAPEPWFPLPFFFDCQPEDFVAGRPFRFVANCGWYMIAANAFDAQHFEAVHDRELIGPPTVDCPAPYARRMRFEANVSGRSIFDRLLRRLAGGHVDVAITCWGGPLFVVTGFFRRVRSYILIATQPLDGDNTLTEVIVFAPRSRFAVARLLQPLGLWVRRWFTRAFMADDIGRLGGIRYHPHSLIASDQLLLEFFTGPPSCRGTVVRTGPKGATAAFRPPRNAKSRSLNRAMPRRGVNADARTGQIDSRRRAAPSGRGTHPCPSAEQAGPAYQGRPGP